MRGWTTKQQTWRRTKKRGKGGKQTWGDWDERNYWMKIHKSTLYYKRTHDQKHENTFHPSVSLHINAQLSITINHPTFPSLTHPPNRWPGEGAHIPSPSTHLGHISTCLGPVMHATVPRWEMSRWEGDEGCGEAMPLCRPKPHLPCFPFVPYALPRPLGPFIG